MLGGFAGGLIGPVADERVDVGDIRLVIECGDRRLAVNRGDRRTGRQRQRQHHSRESIA